MTNNCHIKDLIKTLLNKIHLLGLIQRIIRFIEFKMHYLRYKIVVILFKNNFNKQAASLTRIIGSRVIYIDPKIIKRSIRGAHRPEPAINFIFNKHWDINKKLMYGEVEEENIEKSSGYKAIKELFIEKIPRENSTQFKTMKRQLEKGRIRRNCSNLVEINNYFDKLVKTFENIRDEGYKTQVQLKKDNSNFIADKEDEINLFIDRNGNILGGYGGRHRLAIAKILNIEKVPALIIGVHYRWAKKCFKTYGLDLLSSINKGLEEVKLTE